MLMKKGYLAFAAVMTVLVLSLLSCSKDSSLAQPPLDYEKIASEHSAALEYFFTTTSRDELTTLKQSTKGSDGSNVSLLDEYIRKTINEFSFAQHPEIVLPNQTKSENISELEINEIIRASISKVVGDYTVYSSKDKLKAAIANYLSSIENVYPKEIIDVVSISLYILLDSYDYWIEQDGFARWGQEFLSEDELNALVEQYNLPDISNTTKSGAEMRAWSEMARADAAAGGFLADCIDSDANGFIGGLVLGKFIIQAGLASAAWSSCSTYLKNLLR